MKKPQATVIVWGLLIKGNGRLFRRPLFLILAARRFLLLNTIQFAFGNKPTLASDVGQNFAFGHSFVKAAQQLFRRFAGLQDNLRQCSHPLVERFCPDFLEQCSSNNPITNSKILESTQVLDDNIRQLSFSLHLREEKRHLIFSQN